MGNNHNQYFGKDKRKIIVLGLEGSGKTTLLEYLVNQKISLNQPPQKTKALQLYDKSFDGLKVTFFDLGGSQRQRVFWKQQYEGTQGVIFVINPEKYTNERVSVQEELSNLAKNLNTEVPFCICLSHIDKVGAISTKVKADLQKQLQPIKKTCKIYELDYKNKDSMKAMMAWLLKETKPI